MENNNKDKENKSLFNGLKSQSVSIQDEMSKYDIWGFKIKQKLLWLLF